MGSWTYESLSIVRRPNFLKECVGDGELDFEEYGWMIPV
jgi:hypothetical protein